MKKLKKKTATKRKKGMKQNITFRPTPEILSVLADAAGLGVKPTAYLRGLIDRFGRTYARELADEQKRRAEAYTESTGALRTSSNNH